MPTVRVKDKKNHKKVVWEESGIKLLKTFTTEIDGQPDEEVHLGVECPSSATNTLCNLPVGTALRQLHWTILDPLVAGFVFRRKIPSFEAVLDPKYEEKNNVGYLIHNELGAIFNSCPKNEIAMWSAFQQAMGIVDFFGIYKVGAAIDTPGLFRFLGHIITRKDATVATDTNESSDEVDCGMESKSNKIDRLYVPVFQPFPSCDSPPLIVSDDVFSVMLTVVGMVTTAVQGAITKDPNLKDSFFISKLRKYAWFPVHLMSELSIGNSSKFCVVAAPVNIFHCTATQQNQYNNHRGYQSIQQKQQHLTMVSVFPLGPHVFYLPEEAHFSNESDSLFQLNSIHNNDFIDKNLLFNYFLWMSRQKNVSIVCSISCMRKMYSNIYDFLDAYPMENFSKTIKALLERDEPFLWFPDVLDHQDQDKQISGKFFSLSKVFEFDPTPLKSFRSVPHIKEICSSYFGAGDFGVMKFQELFARRKCCNVCKAAEGMYGVKGLPCGTSYGELTCTCIDISFGKFVPHMGGLVRKTPSLADTIALLQFRIAAYIQGNCDNDSLIKSVREEERETALRDVKNMLESISREVWKCFHIKGCLHPYSPEALVELKATFARELLLPAIGRADFVSVSEAGSSIAVDDPLVLELFRNELSDIDAIQWIDAEVLQQDFFLPSDTDSSGQNIYDLDLFKQENESFLQLDKVKFSNAANSLPMETFFAPQNMLALLEFLAVPKLTSFVKSEWKCKEILQPNYPSLVLTLLNQFLFVSQIVLWVNQDRNEGLIHTLTNSERMKKILQVNIVSCSSISRICRLTLKDLKIERSHDAPYYFDTSNNTIYVDQKIDKSIAIKFCIDLVMSVVRFEMAKLLLNQNIELMTKLQNALSKIANLDREKLMVYLEIEYQSSLLPESMLIWQIENAVETVCVDSNDDKLGEHEVALRGLQKMIPKSAANNIPRAAREKEISVEYAQYLQKQKAEQEERAKAILAVCADSKVVVAEGDIQLTAQNVLEEDTAIATFNKSKNKSFDAKVERNEVLVETAEKAEAGAVGWNSDYGEDCRRQSNSTSVIGNFEGHHNHSINEANHFNIERVGANNNDLLHGNGFHLIPTEEKSSLLRIDVSELNFAVNAIVTEVCSIRQLGELQGGDSNNAEQVIPFNANDLSGRIGERAGHSALQLALKGEYSNIQWVNNDSESGLPYDYVITMTDGSQKFCEVKTRTSDVPVNQWFISSTELKFAEQKRHDYIVLLLWLRELTIDGDNYDVKPGGQRNSFRVEEAALLGLRGGLTEVLRSKQAKLIIQANLR